MTDANELRTARVRERAYELWQTAGSPMGHDDHFWLCAEREIKGEEHDHDKAMQDGFPASDPPSHSGITA